MMSLSQQDQWDNLSLSTERNNEMTTATLCDRLEHETRNEGKNNKPRLQSIAQEHGRYGSSEWFRLPYLDMQEKHCPVEPMHAVKVVAEHITKMVNGDEDGPKVRAQERSMNRFVNCCPDQIFNIYVKESYVMHLLHHLPMYIRRFGPPSNFWMFPYERFNKTLSEAITNSKHPELNAVMKIEMQWLLTMLESSGFLEPLRSRPVPRNLDQENLNFLHAGQFKPTHRQANQQEEEALLEVYKTPLIDDNDIIVYHYARKAGPSSTIIYRDVVVEQPTSQYSASVVSCQFSSGQFVGVIQYCFSHQFQQYTNELAFINWVGQPEKCHQSMCSKFQPPPVMWVSQLSEPLIHAWEDGHLWLPTI